uniref:Uncharacterized protein n=1 Tax=Anopheles maculatus TaxID=74869 RepID=A0A182SGI3_9DIPT
MCIATCRHLTINAAVRESTMRLPEVNDGSGSSSIVSSVSDGHISTNSIISNNIDNDDVSRAHELKNGTIEYAYITKLARPLHQDDLLYESKTDVSDGRRSSQIHATGAFRSRSSKIWDPHPEYELNAFGIRMHLKLSHDVGFIQKDMKVIGTVKHNCLCFVFATIISFDQCVAYVFCRKS